MLSASSQDESQALDNGNFTTVPASEQTHCALVVCDSEWVTVALNSVFECPSKWLQRCLVTADMAGATHNVVPRIMLVPRIRIMLVPRPYWLYSINIEIWYLDAVPGNHNQQTRQATHVH